MPQEPEELLAELQEANRKLSEERRIFVSGPAVVFKWRNEEAGVTLWLRCEVPACLRGKAKNTCSRSHNTR